MTEPTKHCATFTPSVQAAIQELWEDLPGGILDPFAGIGTIHGMGRADTFGIEIEPEWADQHDRTLTGDSLGLVDLLIDEDEPTYRGIVTSPTYGNRMADQYDGRDGSTRATYAISLGHEVHDASTARLQWGQPYRHWHHQHIQAWRRLLDDEGWVILNMKDHPRGGERMRVCRWWLHTMLCTGFDLVTAVQVDTPGMKFGAQGDIDIGHEMVYLFETVPGFDTNQGRLL